MFIQYLQAGLKSANYEMLEDNSFYGEIPNFQGVYANAKSLEACRKELKEVLEEWILFRIHKNLSLPKIGNIEIKIQETA